MNLADGIRKVFEKLFRDLKGLRGIVISTIDGLPVASDMKSSGEEDRISAIISSIAILSKKVAPQLNIGGAEDFMIEGENGKVFFYSIGEDAILALITDREVNLGMIRMVLPGIREELEELML